MGVVYRAVDELLGRPVAIKMIRSALLGDGEEAEESVARFLREARAAAQIRSNHVAHVLQFGRSHAGDLFLVLEYLDGVTLADLLRQEGRLRVERGVRILRQVCRGMEAAHQMGIVHRDLKPSNVMLVPQDGDPEFAKILDFGVAKVLGERESGVTRTGMLVGTYTCMAPEQVANDTIDARTDIYALAVMLFRVLTGRSVFEGREMTTVLYHHVHTPAPRPSSVAPDAQIPPALDRLLLRCLQKDPQLRPQSMAELDRELGACLYGETRAHSSASQLATAVDDVAASQAGLSTQSARAVEEGGAFRQHSGTFSGDAVETRAVPSGPHRAAPPPDEIPVVTGMLLQEGRALSPHPPAGGAAWPAPGSDPLTPRTSSSQSIERAGLSELSFASASLVAEPPSASAASPVASASHPAAPAPAPTLPRALVYGAPALIVLVLGGGVLFRATQVLPPAAEVSAPARAATGADAADLALPRSPPAVAGEAAAAPALPVGVAPDTPGPAAAAPETPATASAAPDTPGPEAAAPTVAAPSGPSDARPETASMAAPQPARAERSRNPAVRKKGKSRRTARAPESDDDDEAAPRFIRVRTGDGDD